MLIEKICEIALQYPDAGYGKMFYSWLLDDDKEPYGGYTNGSAMRVSPTAWAVDTLEHVECLAKWSAEITHDHQEGIKGAQAVTVIRRLQLQVQLLRLIMEYQRIWKRKLLSTWMNNFWIILWDM